MTARLIYVAPAPYNRAGFLSGPIDPSTCGRRTLNGRSCRRRSAKLNARCSARCRPKAVPASGRTAPRFDACMNYSVQSTLDHLIKGDRR